MKRESFRSRLGFLLVSAGCAIGIGNVWRFPYVTGKNGGGYFVLFYILCLLIMGVPVLTMELAVGRASRKSAIIGAGVGGGRGAGGATRARSSPTRRSKSPSPSGTSTAGSA